MAANSHSATRVKVDRRQPRRVPHNATAATRSAEAGLDIGPAYVGMVGEGDVRDFTAIGDVVNTASRLQGVAQGGQIVMSEAIAREADVPDGTATVLDLKGKAKPVPACVVTVGR